MNIIKGVSSESRRVLEMKYHILFLKVIKSQEVFLFPIHLQKIKLQFINFLSQMKIY